MSGPGDAATTLSRARAALGEPAWLVGLGVRGDGVLVVLVDARQREAAAAVEIAARVEVAAEVVPVDEEPLDLVIDPMLEAPTRTSGLHVGAPISVWEGYDGWGGVGCLLGEGAAPTHLLTAGHLFSRGLEGRVRAAYAAQPLVEIGALVANLLDRSDGPAVDVAAIELNAIGREMARRSDWGPRVHACAAPVPGTKVRAFRSTWLAMSGASALRDLVTARIRVESSRRGRYHVTDPIQTRSVITAAGDSGTGLFGPEDALLGTCIGARGGSLFEPLLRCLPLLGVHGVPDTVWRSS